MKYPVYIKTFIETDAQLALAEKSLKASFPDTYNNLFRLTGITNLRDSLQKAVDEYDRDGHVSIKTLNEIQRHSKPLAKETRTWLEYGSHEPWNPAPAMKPPIIDVVPETMLNIAIGDGRIATADHLARSLATPVPVPGSAKPAAAQPANIQSSNTTPLPGQNSHEHEAAVSPTKLPVSASQNTNKIALV